MKYNPIVQGIGIGIGLVIGSVITGSVILITNGVISYMFGLF